MATQITENRPTLRSGKICYLEIPATDIAQSAEFYRQALGWGIRKRGDGSIAFDDSVNEVSGTWVVGRPPMTEAGQMVYVMVADARQAIAAIKAAGGEIVRDADPQAREMWAWFRDPGGNLMGIYQQPGLAQADPSRRG